MTASEVTTRQYNGWANYETWVVKLWMDNDEGSYHYWRGETEAAWNSAAEGKGLTRSEVARYDLATFLQEKHEEDTPTVTGVYGDLLNAALSEVDWREIADSLLGDMNERLDANEEKYEVARC